MIFGATPQTGGGSKDFLSMKDQETVSVVVRGNPHEFYSKWENGKSSEVPEGTAKASFRFRINVVLQENGAMTPKIWEQGATVYNALKELHEEYDLTKTVLKIKRDGIGMDTSYSLLPGKKELTKEQVDKINQIPLLALKKETKLELDNKSSDAAFALLDEDEEIPL